MTIIRPSSTATTDARLSSAPARPAAATALSADDAFAGSPLGQSIRAARDDADRFERSIPGKILGGPVGKVLIGAALCAPGAAAFAGIAAVVGGSAVAGAVTGTGVSLFALMTANGTRGGE